MSEKVMPKLLKSIYENWKERFDDLNNVMVQVLKRKLVNKKLHVIRRDLGQNFNKTKEVKGILTDIKECKIHPNGLPEFLFVFDGHVEWWVNQFTEITEIS